MPKRKPITSAAVLLALPMLLLTACQRPALRVSPDTPICPEPIVLPRSMTDPVTLPKWLPYPEPITTPSPVTALASPKCAKMSKP